MDAFPKRTIPVIPVLGFATLTKFDMAQRLLNSIDHPVEHVVIVDNSGTKAFRPFINENVRNLWHIQVPHGLGANGAWNLIIKSTPHAPYWVIPNDDSWFEPGALAEIAENADPEAFNFVDVTPKWSCVVPGEGAILKAGLWDEAFHPIYFDDDDYEWRMEKLGVKFNHISAKVNHDNSSTLHSGFQDRNNRTYTANHNLYSRKRFEGNLSEIGWKLKIRRENRWD